MSDIAVGVVGLAALFVLMGLRVPVGMAMLAVGFGGIWALSGLTGAMSTMTSMSYSMSNNGLLVIIPLFILMGNVAGASGLSRRLFDAAYAWIGGMRGGMASASVVGCAGFAAVSGSSIATAVTMGRVALPEMKRFGYDPRLATGAVAAGGTLGILIPPSAGFVVYALLTEQSIGQLFMAGVIPGILLAGLFVLFITVRTTLKPEIAPRAQQTSWTEKWQATRNASPIIAIILATIGGIYLGVFTAEEAAGIGALLMCIIALLGRLMTLSDFWPVLIETSRTTAMLFFILIGAAVFAPFLSFATIPESLAESLGDLGLGAYGTLAIILLGYIVLGTFLESFGLVVITIPIVFPIITKLGFDPIWFGVMVVIVVEMGLITPPVGLNVFVVKGVAGPEVPMSQIFAGVFPFWVAMLVCLVLLVLFPSLSLFLPSTMFR